jgi:hypothetical protein
MSVDTRPPPQVPVEAPPPPQPTGPPTGRIVFGILLICIGAVLLLQQLGIVTVSLAVFLAAALVVVGAAVTVYGFLGQPHHGLRALGIVLTIVLSLVVVFRPLGSLRFTDGVGDRTERPTDAAELADGYGLALGQLEIDLRDVRLPEGTTTLEASVGMGQLVVRLPEGAAVKTDAQVTIGDTVLPGTTQTSGIGVRKTAETEGFDTAGRRLELDLSVGIGQIEVRQ